MLNTKSDLSPLDSHKRERKYKVIGLCYRGENRSVVSFDTWRILQRSRTCGFPATAQLSCWSLSADCSGSSVKKWGCGDENDGWRGRGGQVRRETGKEGKYHVLDFCQL